MKQTICIAFLLTISQGVFGQQQDFSKVQLTSTKVRGNIHMLQGVGGFAGGNMGVSAGKDGILIVDDQLAPMTDKIRSALSAFSGELRFVLNTHWHGDHTGGNDSFGKQALIVAHENVRKRMQSDQKNFFGETPARAKEAWPQITFDKSLNIHFNGEDIRFLHFSKGHTDGDGMVYFTKSNVLHMGDLFFSGMFPFIDLDGGGDVTGFTNNVKKVLETMPADVKIIPGHGPLATMKDLQATHKMLVGTVEYIRKTMHAGKSLSEIQKAGLPKKWEAWGKGVLPEKAWIGIVHRSITRDSATKK